MGIEDYIDGNIPDRYHYQMVNKPYEAYKKQRKKAQQGKRERQEMTFAEKFLMDLAQAELYAILQKVLDDTIDQFNAH